MTNLIKDISRVFIGELIPDKYLISPYMMVKQNLTAVFLPINTKEVSDIVKYCNDNNLVFIPRGANTGVVGSQNQVIGNEVIIDLSLMNKILDFDLNTLTLTVEAGITLGEVYKYLEVTPYFYPPDPGSKDSTIGGNVNTNAGGMRAIKYGTTRNYIKELELVLPNGNITTFGSLNVKDQSGYDLKDLIIGSEGTLAIVTTIKLKVIKRPNFSKSIILAFDNSLDATNTVISIKSKGFDPTALEMFDKETISYSERDTLINFPCKRGNVFILATFEDNILQDLNNTLKRLVKLYEQLCLDIIILNKEDERFSWLLRDNILLALNRKTKFEMLDEVVPINNFSKIIEFSKRLGLKHRTTILNFGHAGDGNIHTLLLQGTFSDNDWQIIRTKILDELYDYVKVLGGLISAEHGIGYIKKDYFHKYTNQNNLELMRLIKKSFDPKGLLNPNKII